MSYPNQQPKYLVVQIPHNIYPGLTFQARAPSGNIIQVVAPIGSEPGSKVKILNPEYQEPAVIMAQPAPVIIASAPSPTQTVVIQQPQPYIQPVIIENNYVGGMPYYDPYAASAGFVAGAAAGAIVTENMMFNNGMVYGDPFIGGEVIMSSNTCTDVVFF